MFCCPLTFLKCWKKVRDICTELMLPSLRDSFYSIAHGQPSNDTFPTSLGYFMNNLHFYYSCAKCNNVTVGSYNGRPRAVRCKVLHARLDKQVRRQTGRHSWYAAVCRGNVMYSEEKHDKVRRKAKAVKCTTRIPWSDSNQLRAPEEPQETAGRRRSRGW